MKKLLSLLSVLTISGAAMPNVIAASNYEKHNIKDLSELNWTDLITNKNKRDVNNIYKHIFKTYGADKPTEQQIKDKLKELNPQLDITKINIENITDKNATITVIGYSNKKIINFKVDKSFDLKKIIINTDLGPIITSLTEDNKNINLATSEQIKDKLKELNPQLDITKINVENITENSARIISNDNTFYSGNPINVNYVSSIKTFITNTDLGPIITDGINLPTSEQIKDKLKEKNILLYLTSNSSKTLKHIEITDIKPTSAKIEYKYKNIFGDITTVKFTYNINLDKIIKYTNLSEFNTSNLSNPSNQQIKEKLKELNPQLDITKINVTNITENSARIISNDNTFYSGNPINVNYTVSIQSINW